MVKTTLPIYLYSRIDPNVSCLLAFKTIPKFPIGPFKVEDIHGLPYTFDFVNSTKGVTLQVSIQY